MKKFNKKAFIIFAIVALLILTACNNNAAEPNTEVPEDTEGSQNQIEKSVVNIGVTYEPSNINPLAPVGLVSTYVAKLLFLPLVELDSNLEFQPMLADAITTEDNQTFTIKLNEDAKWTDGTDVTSDDVIFTLELMTNPVVASNYAYMFAIIEGLDDYGYLPEGQTAIAGVSKIDDSTVEVTTKSPTTLQIFQDTIGRNLLTLPKAELEHLAPADVNTSEFMQKPDVTNGPFILSELNRDHYVEMVPNENYFKGAPKLDQLNFKVLEGNQIAPQLMNGEIDMNIPSAGVIPINDYKLFQTLDNVEMTYGEPLATQFIYINENVLPDQKQRQAISYALNRELIVNNLLQGAGEVTDGFFTSISPYIHEDLAPVEYDAEKAKQLLSESGWDSSQTLTLAVLSGDATLEQAANIVAENLGEIGLQVKIQMMDLGTLINEIVSMEYDLAILTVSMTPINPLPDIAYFLGEGNPNAYSNERVNEILAALSQEVDEGRIKELYGELQTIMKEDVPMPSIYATKALGVMNKRVKHASPSDFGMFINVHEWTIE